MTRKPSFFENRAVLCKVLFSCVLFFSAACSHSYLDPDMDFGVVRTVAVMPFENLTNDKRAGERVRDVFSNLLLSTGAIYVLPPGEVRRGIRRTGMADSSSPSSEEIVKLANVLKAEAVITGVVREYGEVRSGPSVANTISISLQMIEAETGRVVWSAATTKGGITTLDRLFGGGGEPMNDVTVEAVNELIRNLFR